MDVAQVDTGENQGGRNAARAGGRPGTARLIRLLVALAGGDPRQCQLPPLRRPLQVTVQPGAAPDLRFIVVAPAGRAVAGSFVYLAGWVTAVRENQVQVQGEAGALPVWVTLCGEGEIPEPGQWVSACGTVQGADIVIEQWEVKDV